MTDHDPKCLAYGFGPGQRMDICICTGIRIGREAERERIVQGINKQRIDISAENWMDGFLTVEGREYRLTKAMAQTINAIRSGDIAIVLGRDSS